MKIYIYKEDDWIAEVEILEDLSDKKYLSYRLKVIKTIRPSRIYTSTEDGHIFRCTRLKEYKGPLWSLEEKKE